jgi:hypothetical protein
VHEPGRNRGSGWRWSAVTALGEVQQRRLDAPADGRVRLTYCASVRTGV